MDSPFGWVSRDHRKSLSVDGHVGFVTGLCVGRMWVGHPEKNLEPWRDTGVQIRGPSVANIEQVLMAGTLLLALAILFAFFPRILAYPLTVIFLWIAVTLLYKSYKLHRKRPDSPPRTKS